MMRGHLLGCSVVLGVLVSCSSIPSGSPTHEAIIDEFVDKSYLRQEVTQQSVESAQPQVAKVAQPGS